MKDWIKKNQVANVNQNRNCYMNLLLFLYFCGSMHTISEYFAQFLPQLSPLQLEQLGALQALYAEWNDKINVVSRQDIENLNERHVLHSLGIALHFQFKPGAHVLDLGTGGGFPGIPLAIAFPETKFLLTDGTGKKIKVVNEVAQALGLTNVTGRHARVEELKMYGNFDFVVTRGVTTLDKLMAWSRPLLKRKHQHAYPNGLIALKGGDLTGELALLEGNVDDYTEIFPLRERLSAEFFSEKFVVYVQG
jgi:16S rRNA (guanine527-N7)-methyltransferase